MSAVIFAGPSARQAELLAACNAEILPPAAMGDVYRAARKHPRAIGIIDGYFEGAPSVWHKEILWAMGEGIEVFGAASMGALRAAELASFGMRGVGDIFADYLSGRLEDDDEVAVEHGPAELGFITLSEPMVNIRATLARAAADGIIGEVLSRDLASLAKRQFYKERNWPSLLQRARANEAAAAEIDRLAGWLPGHAIDLKHADALKMAAAMAEFLSAPGKPAAKNFAFEWTVMWDKATRSFNPDEMSSNAALVLEELRLDPERYAAIRRGAIARKLLNAGTSPDHSRIDAATLRRTLSRFQEKHGLLTRHALMEWLAENGLDEIGLERLMEDETRLDGIAAAGGLDRYVLAELQQAGAYADLARRARDKRKALDESDRRQWQGRLHVMQARLWYFESRLGRPLPNDLVQYAKEVGFADAEALDGAIAREFAFESRTKNTGDRADKEP